MEHVGVHLNGIHVAVLLDDGDLFGARLGGNAFLRVLAWIEQKRPLRRTHRSGKAPTVLPLARMTIRPALGMGKTFTILSYQCFNYLN